MASSLLYFTDKQVYFESESSVESELTSTTRVRIVETDEMCTLVHLRSLLKLRESTKVYHSIGVYSRRQISFQKDTINALLGILVLYERLYTIRHLWGLLHRQYSFLNRCKTVQKFHDIRRKSTMVHT